MDLTFNDGNTSEWEPLQFHFHTPSEHTIMGEHMNLEMHVVHLSPTGALGAVIGIMFDVEKGGNGTNMFLKQMEGLATVAPLTAALSFKGFLQTLDTSEFWSYDGSLTTPPCTEGVKWSVLKTIQPISTAQLAIFGKGWNNNARGKGDNRAV